MREWMENPVGRPCAEGDRMSSRIRLIALYAIGYESRDCKSENQDGYDRDENFSLHSPLYDNE